MSFKQIKELRQAGQLDEALRIANEALEAEPTNIWNKRAAAWVYYDYLKLSALPETFESFKENLLKIKNLQLPEDETMVFDNCAWQVGSLVFKLQKQEHLDYSKLNELFEIISDFQFTKPSEGYAFLYKAFHKGYQNWSKYLAFADWWDFKHLRPEDYLKEDVNGKKIMAIAEQAYIAYAKKLLDGIPLDTYGQKRAIDTEKIQRFLPKLDALIEKHPEYQYPPYFKAKLLLTLGDSSNVLSAFIPFAKQKRNDFWTWEMMAEMFPNNEDLQFSCYCKALSLKTSEDFLIKLRQAMAKMLVDKQMFNEAKTEIQKCIATREKNGWKIPPQLMQWSEQPWFQSAVAGKDNNRLYSKHIRLAEELLFQDTPEEIVVVEFVNRNKSILNFVKDTEKSGFFNYSGHLENPAIGDKLKVRFNGDGRNGHFKVFSVGKADDASPSEAVKKFVGVLEIIPTKNFGFLDDIFFDAQFISANQLSHGQELSGQAMLSFNKKQNKWGWKAIKIGTETQGLCIELQETAKKEEHFEEVQSLLPYLTELQEGFVKSGYTVAYSFGLASEAEGGNLLLSESGRASFYISATKGEEMLELRLTLTKRLTEKVSSALGETNFRADYGDNAGQAAVRAALPVIGNRRIGKHSETGALFMF